MWFILLFALSALAIPVALEVSLKGSDNILSRSGAELVDSELGRRIARTFGLTKGWVYGVALLSVISIVLYGVFWLVMFLVWVVGLFF